jgi:hypothetical protein
MFSESTRGQIGQGEQLMEEKTKAHDISVGKPEGRRPLQRSWCQSEKLDGKVWAGFICLWVRTSGSSCKHGNKPSGPIK